MKATREKIRPPRIVSCPACGNEAQLSREAGGWGLYVCTMAQECPEFERKAEAKSQSKTRRAKRGKA